MGGASFVPVNPYLEPHPWETEMSVALVIIIKTGKNQKIYLYENDQYSVTFLHEMSHDHLNRATRPSDTKISEGMAVRTAASTGFQAVAGEEEGSKDGRPCIQVLVMNSKEKSETI